jgi:hypothetical protein
MQSLANIVAGQPNQLPQLKQLPGAAAVGSGAGSHAFRVSVRKRLCVASSAGSMRPLRSSSPAVYREGHPPLICILSMLMWRRAGAAL